MEPHPDKHYFFETYEEAQAAWVVMQDNEEIDLEIRQKITGPRQTHGGWIFDRETQWQ